MWNRIFLVFTVFGILGCEKPAPPAPIPTPTPAATPKPTPISTPQPTATPIPTPEARLAPEGIYYVVKDTSITTDDGVLGIPMGSKVTLIEKTGGKFKVSYQDQTLDLSADFVTRDLNILDGVIRERQRKRQAAAQIEAQPEIVKAARTGRFPEVRQETQEDNSYIILKKQRSLMVLQLSGMKREQARLQQSLQNRGVKTENSPSYYNLQSRIESLENQIFQFDQNNERNAILAN